MRKFDPRDSELKWDSLSREVGILPDRKLYEAPNSRRLVISPSDDGRVPVSSLDSSISAVRAVSRLTVEGMVPCTRKFLQFILTTW